MLKFERMARYIVRARVWRDFEGVPSLIERFGKGDSVHDLSDTEVVQAVLQFGRAEIIERADGLRVLNFHNDYD